MACCKLSPCTKRPLDKILAELIVARNMSKKNPMKRHENRAYLCNECSEKLNKEVYHLTSTPPNIF